MPSKCAVLGCKSPLSKGGKVQLHQFPKEKHLKQKWMYLCQGQHKNVPATARVCSLHFEVSAYKRLLKYELLKLPVPGGVRRLKEDALPTLHLPPLKGGRPESPPRAQTSAATPPAETPAALRQKLLADQQETNNDEDTSLHADTSVGAVTSVGGDTSEGTKTTVCADTAAGSAAAAGTGSKEQPDRRTVERQGDEKLQPLCDKNQTSVSKVCERHFQPEDILWVTSYHDERTGRTLTAKLQKPRLRKGAIPSKLLDPPPQRPAEEAKKPTPRQSTRRPHQRRSQNHMEKDIKTKPAASCPTPLKAEATLQAHLQELPQDDQDNDELFDDDLEVEIKEEVVDDELPETLETTSCDVEPAVETKMSTEMIIPESKPSTSYISVTPLHKVLPTIDKPITLHTRLADMDEFHLFGMNVASQLRALPLHDALQAQLEIQTILAQKRSQILT